MSRDQYPELTENLVEQANTLLQIHDSISKVVQELEIPVSKIDDTYTKSGDRIFELESMIRVFTYKEVGDFSDLKLADRFETWAYLQQRFGLKNRPSQGTLSYTWRNRFTPPLRRVVEAVARAIHTEAHEQDIVSEELAPPLSDDTESETPQPLHHYVDQHVPKIIDLGREHIFSAFDTERASNTKHSDMAIWESQTKMSLMKRVGSRGIYRMLNRKQEDALHNDTHVRAIK
ncbi:hypothetical protein [Halostagnicola bangensis]